MCLFGEGETRSIATGTNGMERVSDALSDRNVLINICPPVGVVAMYCGDLSLLRIIAVSL